jgi:DNA polymerase
MAHKQLTAAPFVPPTATLEELALAVQQCQGCELYRNATQAVFGQGPACARIIMVGEQPGDQEDLQGRPFIGPAGRLLDRALEEAGITRSEVYVTNAVKHFKFEVRGKRRIHKKPNDSEMGACRPWLEAEVARIHPQVIVCLGSTAARSVIGKEHRVLKDRGKFKEHSGSTYVTSTVHPSALLRAIDPEQRHAAYQEFVEDLRRIKIFIDQKAGARSSSLSKSK